MYQCHDEATAEALKGSIYDYSISHLTRLTVVDVGHSINKDLYSVITTILFSADFQIFSFSEFYSVINFFIYYQKNVDAENRSATSLHFVQEG